MSYRGEMNRNHHPEYLLDDGKSAAGAFRQQSALMERALMHTIASDEISVKACICLDPKVTQL